LICAASLVVGSAHAQNASASGRVSVAANAGDVTYGFEDDSLEALGNTHLAMIAVVRGRSQQAGLIRPRAQFVTEMLKSVEAL
jgi:hypothetical protein